MINEFILYIIQSSVIFSLLFIPYLWMRNDTFFIRNRIYLISSVFISLILPWMKFEIPTESSAAKIMLEEITIYPGISKLATGFSFSEIISGIILVISFLFLIRLIIAISNLFVLIIKHPKERRKEETIVWLEQGGDFSFFGFIFLSREKYHPYILEHERVHVKRKHSYDILLFELMRCFHWFNPFVWMALNEIKALHEYEADELTAGKNKNEYQALLLSSVLEADLVPMTNSFHCLTIKKRFVMMNKKRSPKKAAAKFLVAVPFLLFSLGIFAVNSPEVISKFTSANEIKGGGEGEITQPEFKGGMEALVKYLSENIKYPEKAKNENVSGKVYVSFVINAKGKVKDAKIEKGVNAELDAEALRVVKGMPDWTPGKKDGKNAEVTMTLPISFQL